MCGETKKDIQRDINKERFRTDLHKFLEEKMLQVHPEYISEALLYEATNSSCFWFGCYLHMLGFLTSELHRGLEEKFNNIRKLVEEARKERNATDTM